MDFGLIALGLVVVGKILDYVAPKTKTKVDDKVRDVFNRGKDMVLPMVEKMLPKKAAEEPKPEVKVSTDAQGRIVRDHR